MLSEAKHPFYRTDAQDWFGHCFALQLQNDSEF
jgi:hypothetical protein